MLFLWEGNGHFVAIDQNITSVATNNVNAYGISKLSDGRKSLS